MELILSLILCFFAVYGIFQLLYDIACKTAKSDLTVPKQKHIAINANANPESLESYIRYLSFNENGTEIILLYTDDASLETKKLIELLCAEFDEVNAFTADEYKNYISDFIK